MQAYAEGYELLACSGLDIDAKGASSAWRQGSVVRSWLLDLLVRALDQRPGLDGLAPVAQDSGEGRWTVQEAIERGVATPVISVALYARFVSQDQEGVAMRAIAALREQFGGHAVLPEDAPGEAAPPVAPADPAANTSPDAPPSDALVLFGATGDLAKKKIFPAVYEMTRIDHDHVPVIGFASSEWDDEHLRQHAREAIEAKGPCGRGRVGRHRQADDLRARRLPRSCFLRAPRRSIAGGRGGAAAVLPGRPAGALRRRHHRPREPAAPRGCPRRGGEALRARPELGPGAQPDPPPRLPGDRRLPHRSLPRQGVGREPARVPVRQLDARADLEPALHLQRADHDGRGVRTWRSGAGSTRRWARCATSCRTTSSRWWRCWPWSRRSGPTPTPCATSAASVPPDPDGGGGVRRPGPVPRLPRTSRASTPAPTSRRSWPCTHRDRLVALGRGVPWLIRAGKHLPVTATEAVGRVHAPPRLLFSPSGFARPAPPTTSASGSAGDDGVMLHLRRRCRATSSSTRPVDLEVVVRRASSASARRRTNGSSRTPWSATRAASAGPTPSTSSGGSSNPPSPTLTR